MKLLLADDHPLVLCGLQSLLAQESGFDIVGTAKTPSALLSLLEETECDVVVADYAMPGESDDGWRLFVTILNKHPNVRLVAYTAFAEPQIVAGLMRLRIDAVVSKGDMLSHLVHAIKAVAGGARYLSPVAEHALGSTSYGSQLQWLERLTPREVEVLGLFAAGLSVSETALLLGRSVKTVSTQKTAIKKKMCVHSDFDLYRHAAVHGLLMQPAPP